MGVFENSGGLSKYCVFLTFLCLISDSKTFSSPLPDTLLHSSEKDYRGYYSALDVINLHMKQEALDVLQRGKRDTSQEFRSNPLMAAAFDCPANAGKVANEFIRAAGKKAFDYIFINNAKGFNVIHVAALRPCAPVVKAILDLIPNIRPEDLLRKSHRTTALHLAASRGATDVVELLAKHIGSRNVELLYTPDDVISWTPLDVAIARGNVEVVNALLEHTVAPKALKRKLILATDPASGKNIFHTIIQSLNDTIPVAKSLQLLIDQFDDADKDAVLHATDKSGVSPLHYAAVLGKRLMVAVLLQAAPGNVNARLKRFGDLTPLMAAASIGDEAIVAMLISVGADPTMEAEDGSDSFDIARAVNCLRCIQIMQGNGLKRN